MITAMLDNGENVCFIQEIHTAMDPGVRRKRSGDEEGLEAMGVMVEELI